MVLTFVSLSVLGRILIGFFFVFFGLINLTQWPTVLQVLQERKIFFPSIALAVGIIWQIGAGILVILNIYTEIAATLLILFTLAAIFIYHPFWRYFGDDRHFHLMMFVSNLTITVGALLVLLNPGVC